MTRWLLLLYPRRFRDRYGDELAELIVRSDHPRSDAINLAVHASRLRLEAVMTRPLRHVLNAVVLLTAFALGYAVNDLQDGVTEVPQHWWSSLALVVLVLAIAARAARYLAEDRRRQSSTP
jgi:hypothetical protein